MCARSGVRVRGCSSRRLGGCESRTAERRRVILSGFGSEDTHHLLHTLRWGHDGALYMNQSIYIHSHVEQFFRVKQDEALIYEQ